MISGNPVLDPWVVSAKNGSLVNPKIGLWFCWIDPKSTISFIVSTDDDPTLSTEIFGRCEAKSKNSKRT